MDNEAGHKRKEFTQKSKSAIKDVGGGIKNFWVGWFGDLKVASRLQKVVRIIISIIGFIIILGIMGIAGEIAKNWLLPNTKKVVPQYDTLMKMRKNYVKICEYCSKILSNDEISSFVNTCSKCDSIHNTYIYPK